MNASEIIRAYYDAFNARDMHAFLTLLDGDVVHDINHGTQEVGRVAFADFMVRMNRCYDEKITDLAVMTGADKNRAAAEFTVIGRYINTDQGLPPAANQAYRIGAGAFFRIKGGKIARITNYYNLQDWLKQVSA